MNDIYKHNIYAYWEGEQGLVQTLVILWPRNGIFTRLFIIGVTLHSYQPNL